MVAAVAALIAAFPAAGAAQSAPMGGTPSSTAEAERLYAEGVAATDVGDFAAGLRAFEAAYAANPLPDTLYNIAMCRMALEDWAGAANTFRDYVTARGGTLPPDEQAEFDALAAELAPRIGRLVIEPEHAGATLLIDGAVTGILPLRPWVAVQPGQHTIAAQKEGFEPALSVVDVGPDETATVQLVVRRLAPHTPPLPSPELLTAEPPTSEPISPWFWASLAVGGAAAAGMAITGGLALKYRSDYEATDYTDVALHDTTAALGLATDVLLGVAAAGAVAALIIGLWPSSEGEESSAGREVGVLVMPAGVTVSW